MGMWEASVGWSGVGFRFVPEGHVKGTLLDFFPREVFRGV